MSSNPVLWHELMTNDTTAAKEFYNKVFGWEPKELASPTGEYTMLTKNGVNVAGILKSSGPPPQWIGYMSTKDVKAAAERAEKAGGGVTVPYKDVGIGEMAILTDTQKAMFALWKSKGEEKSEPEKDNLWSWECLVSGDVEDAWKFYSAVFPDWERTEVGTLRLKGKKEPFGGIIKENFPPAWCTHVRVDDVDKAVAKCKEFGGTVLVEPCDTPVLPHLPYGRLSVIADSQGASIGIFNIKAIAGESVPTVATASSTTPATGDNKGDIGNKDKEETKEPVSGVSATTQSCDQNDKCEKLNGKHEKDKDAESEPQVTPAKRQKTGH